MKTPHPSTYLLAILILIASCSTSKSTSEEQGEEGSLVRTSAEAPPVRQARIFLDGKDKGLTPSVLRIDRRFNYSEVLLRIGKERVRIFEIEQTATSNASEINFSFSAEGNDGFYTQMYVEDLPKHNRREEYFYIPMLSRPLLITDRQYGLEIMIQ